MPENVREEGLEQVTRYRDKIDANAPAYLVIFDRRAESKEKPWEERLSWKNDGSVVVVGC
jgi:hypothetical protein